MVTAWQGNWWAIALRAVAAIVLGIIAFAMPGPTLTLIVVIFGLYALIDGILAIVAAVRGLRRGDRWGAMMVEGVAGVLAGGIALWWPRIGALGLVYLIAAWALATGAFEIAMAIKLRRIIRGEWLLVVLGILSIALAVFLAINPGIGALGIMWMIGAYALVYGGLALALAIRLRHWTRINMLPPASHARG